ncbi:MAG: hydroxymethylbilane synthase [Thermodesulfobacteriota bacterium]|nr:hydroxymethylbilane synthase [Thermodesulfobacteriota bacterium]
MIIGTRGSTLALAQADIVARELQKIGIETEVRTIKTHGDLVTDRPLHELSNVGGVGAFVREIDEHSLAGDIDIAVHSMKDIPTIRPEQLTTAAILKRDPPYDVLITGDVSGGGNGDGTSINDLPAGAVIGTSSLRRRAQLHRFRSDLDIIDLRGNINTRMRKLREGVYDGIILAEAGLVRLGWDIGFERLNIEHFIPSANQGTIAAVTLADSGAGAAVRALDHSQTRIETEIERIVISVLGGGCDIPIGAFAEMVGSDRVRVRAEVLSLDGSRYERVDETIPVEGYVEHAERVGVELQAKGGGALVKEACRY